MAHSPYFFIMFLSYSSLTLILAIESHLGHVVQLHVWHCAFRFSFSKHIFVNFLLYLCHHANSSHEQYLLQLIQYPIPFLSVSLNLAFSCASLRANCNGLIFGHSVLYTLLGLPFHSLISFNILLWYFSSILLMYAFFFLSFFSFSYSNLLSNDLIFFSNKTLYL